MVNGATRPFWLNAKTKKKETAWPTPGCKGSAHIVISALFQNQYLGNFINAIIHEYLHVFQQNTLHMDSHDEREFLANSFTVFPNTSMMRTLVPKWKVELPESTEKQRYTSAKAAMIHYNNLPDEKRLKYKNEFDKVKAVFNDLKSIYNDDKGGGDSPQKEKPNTKNSWSKSSFGP